MMQQMQQMHQMMQGHGTQPGAAPQSEEHQRHQGERPQ
jgi:hypothetical protein